MKHIPILSALLIAALPAHRQIDKQEFGVEQFKPSAFSEGARHRTLWEDRRAFLGGIFAFFLLATCCYLVAKGPHAWREIMHDPSCLPEHRCDAL